MVTNGPTCPVNSITKALIWPSPMGARSASPGVGAARPRIRFRAILRSRTRLTEAIGNAWPTRGRDRSELQLERVGTRQPGRNEDGGFGHYPGSHSDMDAVYFKFGTLLQCGCVSPANRDFPDAHTLSWGDAMHPGKLYD